MSNAASYLAADKLRDGRAVEIRAYRPQDREALMVAAGQVGPRSRYLRFFTVKQNFSEREREFFLNVDFDRHVALVAFMAAAGGKLLVGAGRYVGMDKGRAEVAFTVIDRYQGLGIGTVLMRHLTIVAREAGLNELIAEVLPENKSMLHVFERSGLPMRIVSESDVVHVTLQLR